MSLRQFEYYFDACLFVICFFEVFCLLVGFVFEAIMPIKLKDSVVLSNFVFGSQTLSPSLTSNETLTHCL